MVTKGKGGTPATQRRATPKTPPSSPCVCVPDGLAQRGSALWTLLADRSSDPGLLVLLGEACRTADRLDGLDRILRGEHHELVRVVLDEFGQCELRVDAALSEARQQAGVLRQLIAALPAKEPDDDDADAWLAGLSSPVRHSKN